MVRRNSRRQKFANIAKVIRSMKRDGSYELKDGASLGRKDGGIPTKPTVPCPKISEDAVLSGCISWLLRHRCGAWRMNNGAGDMTGRGDFRTYGITGSGDILCVYQGRHIEIECKRGKGGVLSLNQQKHREQVLRYGGVYLIVHGVEELKIFMDPILRGKHG